MAERETRLLGSGFFLAVGDNPVLVTATHVLDDREKYALHLPHLGVELPPFPVVAGDRSTIDVAAMLLPLNVFPDRQRVRIIAPDELDVNDTADPAAIYCFAGFPQSQNKLKPGRRNKLQLYVHSTRPAPITSYEAVSRDPRVFLALLFAHDKALNRALKPTTPPKLEGISGGPVWRLGKGVDVLSGAASEKLVAIAIEHRPRAGVVLATRISMLVHILRSQFHEMSSLLPEPSLINGPVIKSPGA